MSNKVNKFELILLAAERAKELSHGAKPLIKNSSNEKDTTMALKEIARKKITLDKLKISIKKNSQKYKN